MKNIKNIFCWLKTPAAGRRKTGFYYSLTAVILLMFALSASAINLQKKAELLRYAIDSGKPQQARLSGRLEEISGIAVSRKGEVYGHDDEYSRIFQIDPEQGRIIKTLFTDKAALQGDFEDIAVVNNRFYLIESNGIIHQFTEGKKGNTAEYRRYLTGLTEKNDVEGLCYDPETNSLLLACKAFPGKGFKGEKAVYSFSLSTFKLSSSPRFLIPVREVTGKLRIDRFQPSGIARHSETGSFFVISAADNAIVELSPDGKILEMKRLHEKYHPKPEGIAFLNDGSMLISDEDKKGGLLSRYIRKK